MVDGGILLWDLNEELGLKLETSNYDTLSGYLVEQLGYIPQENSRDEVDLVEEGLRFQIEEVRDNRITKVKLEIRPEAKEE